MLKPSLIAKTDAKASEKQVLFLDGLRITFLTSRLIRVEKAETCTDLPSFTVWFRRFPAGNLRVTKKNGGLRAETDDVIFFIRNGRPYSVYFKDTKKTEYFDKQKNLKGTRRTLDMTFGPAPLEDGLLTGGGAFLLDDAGAALLDEGGHFTARAPGATDYYAFAYGKDYRGTIRAFYRISGAPPLVPRYALGVWWSRYHAYTAQEYLDLTARFRAEDVPLTVATVDMDWHWVHGLKQRFGVNYRGWTGYSWNTALFPDYRDFLRQLKEQGLHVTLNLHPADGVHCYEDAYPAMAKAVGTDPGRKKKVPFLCGNDDFWNAYFDILHKPYEREGVDFWWIDWQQGKRCDVPGLDPLNALNHYHYLDNAEDGRMPLILSRYAGLGSHRYPLGFSGDSAINWQVLDFQPYFTATAANAAYGWWSHDIGGHHMGGRDDDLYLRWLEFGVFSPILRLHSTSSDLLGKEPWKYRGDVAAAAKKWLRFRHRLIPYLFTMDHRVHAEGGALCEPLYYAYPEREEAYAVKNEYFFGSELLLCPITQPQHASLGLGSARAWLPPGEWTDIFTGRRYRGDRFVTLFRELDEIPALARPGAILPLSADEGNGTENPRALELWAFAGNGAFTLTEDNGRADYEAHTARTRFEMTYENGTLTFTVHAAEGDLSVLPQKRDYLIRVKDTPVTFSCKNLDVTKTRRFTAQNVSLNEAEPPKEAVIRLFSRWQENTVKKELRYRPFAGAETADALRAALNRQRLPKELKEAIAEALGEE